MRLGRAIGVLVALGVALALVPVAGARVWHVHHGDSIQDAINTAKSGDKIIVEAGVYRENLTITTNDLTVRGESRRHRPILRPAATPTAGACTDPSDPAFVNGICIVGQFTQTGPGDPVTGTTVENFKVQGYPSFGVFLFNAADTTVAHTVAGGNDGYGISGFMLEKIRFLHNVAHDNGEPGFYIGDSPDADALVVGNKAFRNVGPEGFGFLFRDSSEGRVHDNWAWGNCVGMVFVDSGENPDPLNHWWAEDNHALHNNMVCEGEQGGGPPPTSGIGIALIGGSHVTLRHNVALRNRSMGPSPLGSGGIVVTSGVPAGGADPTDNKIANNRAFHNKQFDISWDGSGSGNTFTRNHCRTSDPSSICD
jgi:hypothetical protein